MPRLALSSFDVPSEFSSLLHSVLRQIACTLEFYVVRHVFSSPFRLSACGFSYGIINAIWRTAAFVFLVIIFSRHYSAAFISSFSVFIVHGGVGVLLSLVPSANNVVWNVRVVFGCLDSTIHSCISISTKDVFHVFPCLTWPKRSSTASFSVRSGGPRS